MILGACRASGPSGARAAADATALLRTVSASASGEPAGRFRGGRTDPNIRGGKSGGVVRRSSSTAEGGAGPSRHRHRSFSAAGPASWYNAAHASQLPMNHHQIRTEGQMLDESGLLASLTPLRRILCVVPVPLGRGRVSWSGGDPVRPDDGETLHLNFGTRSAAGKDRTEEEGLEGQPFRVRRFRYGERYELGLAVTDPGLTRAVPVALDGRNSGDDLASVRGDGRGFTAELVPSFAGDAHGLPSSRPVFTTNLPPTAELLLDRIGYRDVGAVVLATPVGAGTGPYGGGGGRQTKMQLEAERNLEGAGGCLEAVLGNYVSRDYIEECDGHVDADSARRRAVGPLDLQCRSARRLSLPEVLSRTARGGRWAGLAGPVGRLADPRHGAPPGDGALRGVPAGVHAAAALCALLDGWDG